jgi:hypothetical protein
MFTHVEKVKLFSCKSSKEYELGTLRNFSTPPDKKRPFPITASPPYPNSS